LEKSIMRRLLLTASVAMACAALVQPAHAQVAFGVQGALLTGLEEVEGGTALDNGTFGLGGRAEFSPPIPTLSLGLVGQGVWYFPDGDFNYVTYGLGAKVGLSTPMVSPYVIGGWQWRRFSADGFDALTENGPTVDVGVGLGMIPVFVEATFEFNDEDEIDPDFDNNPMVIQAGVLIGG
jgi:hypothetical protein